MRMTVLAIVLALPLACFADQKPLIVHEWGTFTALQDESGRAIGGINIDDEPLPKFIHRFGPSFTSDDNGGKGITVGHPEVTLRLETPVIYFYPPADADKPINLDVSATFNGGLLTEFYPDADKSLNGKPSSAVPAHITLNTRGGLTWSHVTLGGNATLPETDSHVWTAPRAVDSSPVTVGKEVEQYLFYRGCGHTEAPLSVHREADSLLLFAQYPSSDRIERRLWNAMTFPDIWLAEFRGDGTCAFRAISFDPAHQRDHRQPGTFVDADFAKENIDGLKNTMRASLIKNGLFEKEADAMLETWKLSYFHSVGQRLFFLVPRQWTDAVLPLTISKRCDLTRVMVGRIELVTPQQHLAARRLVDMKQPLKQSERNLLMQSLGRFGQPLLQDAARELHAEKNAT